MIRQSGTRWPHDTTQYADGNPVNEDPDEEAGASLDGDAASLEKSPWLDEEPNVVSTGSETASSAGITWIIFTWPGAWPV